MHFLNVYLSAVVFFCPAMLCISGGYAVVRCLSVCLSRSFILSKRINICSMFFSLPVIYTILDFFKPNVIAIFRRDPYNGAIECIGG